MAFEMLQKSQHVAPLLVRLYDTHNLYTLAENKGDEGSCFELATIMTDLFKTSAEVACATQPDIAGAPA